MMQEVIPTYFRVVSHIYTCLYSCIFGVSEHFSNVNKLTFCYFTVKSLRSQPSALTTKLPKSQVRLRAVLSSL